jgi:hypothetical protein
VHRNRRRAVSTRGSPRPSSPAPICGSLFKWPLASGPCWQELTIAEPPSTIVADGWRERRASPSRKRQLAGSIHTTIGSRNLLSGRDPGGNPWRMWKQSGPPGPMMNFSRQQRSLSSTRKKASVSSGLSWSGAA